MVAYSFRPQFAEPIATLAKRQTVRAIGKRRHARPGEPVQLYTGMRTRQCRKLLDIDPICIDVRPITIIVGLLWSESLKSWAAFIDEIVIDGVELTSEQIEAFAVSDGFGVDGCPESVAARRMADFWWVSHGLGLFTGVVIRWEPR